MPTKAQTELEATQQAAREEKARFLAEQSAANAGQQGNGDQSGDGTIPLT